ncbi:hypothetical protein [Nocardioides terrisoli]|uniref:hypothetical protein n=1 Tax=Nocardioides terrisoli TaxID=3388267 RepID=UPI00287BC9A2|nr:hypothetical protein [Nocardioides marmorisolisilvae]
MHSHQNRKDGPQRRRSETAGSSWGRGRLLLLLGGLVVASLLALAGMGLGIYYMLHPAHPGTAGRDHAGVASSGGDARDRIAERPMPATDPDAARPGPLITAKFAVLHLPAPKRLGPVGVSTGFPHTPGGALAQLVAIDQAALQSASVPVAQRVISAWAQPGGPTAQSWSGVKAIADMLGTAGLPATGSTDLAVSASPAMGLIKGTIGDNYVVGCVDFVVTATASRTARTAAADCQRMVWSATDARWLIGPGAEPAQPPSIWPGTEAARAAGYAQLSYE